MSEAPDSQTFKLAKICLNDVVSNVSEAFKLKRGAAVPLDSPLEVGTCVATASRASSAISLTSMVVGLQAAGGLALFLCYNPGHDCGRQLRSALC